VDDLMRLVKVVQLVHVQLATDPAFFASGFLDQELDQAARRSALEENVGELPETYSSRTVEYGAWTDEHSLTLVPVEAVAGLSRASVESASRRLPPVPVVRTPESPIPSGRDGALVRGS
jgi:hypothetical protein